MKSTYYFIENTAAIDNWMEDTRVQYAAHHGNGYNKTLEVNLIGEWIVTDHKVERYKGNRSEAIQTYNSIMPRR